MKEFQRIMDNHYNIPIAVGFAIIGILAMILVILWHGRKKKRIAVKPTGTASVYMHISTGLEPQFDTAHHRRVLRNINIDKIDRLDMEKLKKSLEMVNENEPNIKILKRLDMKKPDPSELYSDDHKQNIANIVACVKTHAENKKPNIAALIGTPEERKDKLFEILDIKEEPIDKDLDLNLLFFFVASDLKNRRYMSSEEPTEEEQAFINEYYIF